MEKTYGQYCPMAAGLDLLGDRWVLLICRELNLGDLRPVHLDACSTFDVGSEMRSLETGFRAFNGIGHRQL